MVKISFLGSCREVGRSAILVEAKSGAKVLLDYGVRFSEEERLPQPSDLSGLEAVALTHCHVDHSGGLPSLYRNGQIPFFTNPITARITDVLLKDMMRISSYNYPFGMKEIHKLMSNSYYLPNSTKHRINDDFSITFYDAGHIPGSVSIMLEVDKKRILYTGDINTIPTRLVESANPNSLPDIDALILESTYALREHPDRKNLEVDFVKNVMNVVDNGGTTLVPAFGVARSQEALVILKKHHYRGRIVIDGMAREIAKIYKEYPESIKNINSYRKSLRNAHFISQRRSRRDRARAKKHSGVIIAPSGMLKGGTAISYAKTFLRDPNSAIYLVGYQVEGSPGRQLIEEGVFDYVERSRHHNNVNELHIEAKCDLEYFDFSSHADGPHLESYVENLNFRNSSNSVFCVHGDNKSTTSLARTLTKKSYNSVAPETGESYIV